MASKHAPWDELAAGWALHALEPDEAVLFELHLESCAECQAAVGEHALVAAQLGTIVGAADEPAEAPSWDRMRRALGVTDVPAAAVAGAAAPVAAAPAAVVDLAEHRARRLRLTRPLLAAAAAVVLIGGGSVIGLRAANPSSPATTASVSISTCKHTVGCHLVALTSAAGGTRATLVVDGGLATVTPSSSLTSAGSGEMYVLWQMPRSGSPVPLGSFQRGSSESSAMTLTTPYDDTAAFAISREDAGALPTSPSTVIAAGPTA